MINGTSPTVRLLRTVLAHQESRHTPDAILLQRIVELRTEDAFHAVVRRHGVMVFNVCRTVLANEADAEDAFQATFLILARKAKAIRKSQSLASWLHGVAYRTSLKAKAGLARRRKHEACSSVPESATPDDLSWRDAQRVIHEELHRLPEQYCAPLALCYLEGKTLVEAARLLALSKDTVRGRLERGRILLGNRLTKRGLGPAGIALSVVWPAAQATAGVPMALVLSTVKAAALAAAGAPLTAGLVSPTAVALMERMVQAMSYVKIKTATAMVLLFAALAVSGLHVANGQGGPEPSAAPVTQKGEKPKPDKERLQGTWKIVSTMEDGEELKEVGEWRFKDTAIKSRSQRKDMNTVMGTHFLRFRLDETTSPKLIDLVEWEDDFDETGERYEGIYSIDGDSLTLCYGAKGSRPTAMQSKAGSDTVLIVLSREGAKEQQKKGDKSGKPEILKQHLEEYKATDPAGGGDPAKPDEKFLVFWRHSAPGPNEIGEMHLARVQPDGTGLKQLTKGWDEDARPDSGWLAVSPDGERIAYTNLKDQLLHVKSLRDGKPGSSLGVKANMWHWSPDGRAILVARDDDAGREFRHELVDVRTKEVRPVRLPAVDRPPGAKHRAGHFLTDWSRDGEWFLTTFQSPKAQEDVSIYLIKRDGSAIKPVAGTEGGVYGRFSPDGKSVLFVLMPKEACSAKDSSHTMHLYAIPNGGGKRRAIEERADRQVMGHTWSPDGRRIAYTYRDVPKKADAGRPTETYLVVVDADGKNPRTLLSEKGYLPVIRTLTAVDWR